MYMYLYIYIFTPSSPRQTRALTSTKASPTLGDALVFLSIPGTLSLPLQPCLCVYEPHYLQERASQVSTASHTPFSPPM